ncbi:MAG: hypothetical protein P8Z36_08220 [Gemmatimonadota bacterium]
MPNHCYFCDAPLADWDPASGQLPTSERAAYDPVHGRLWRICPRCARWNAVPLDLRWEALESFERLARDRGSERLATENLALIAVHDAELVRVGRAPRPEFSGWRYGDRLPARVRGFMARILALFGSLPQRPESGYTYHGATRPITPDWVASPFIDAAGSLAWLFVQIPFAERCPSCGRLMPMRPSAFQDVGLVLSGGRPRVVATCGFCGDAVDLDTRAARPALRLGLAVVNVGLHSTALAEQAGRAIDQAGGQDAFVQTLAQDRTTLGELPDPLRVALGVALDEQVEAEALELEWHAAEELAAIVDGELTHVPGFEEFRRRVLGGNDD